MLGLIILDILLSWISKLFWSNCGILSVNRVGY
jgi:hypothetical protein